MKKLSLIALFASLAMTAGAATDTSDFIEMEFGKDYGVTAFKPFKGKVTAPETGQVIMYSAMPVYTMGADNELVMMSEDERRYAGYINGAQAYQFAAVKDVTYYIWDNFPMNTGVIRLEMNPAVALVDVKPAQNSVYDYASTPHIQLTFNQNVTVGKATLSCGTNSADVQTQAVGSNMSVEINDALGGWFDRDLVKQGDELTVTLSEIKDGLGNGVENITLKFLAPGKPYKMIECNLPAVIRSYMPESNESTKAVFVFDGPMGQNPNIQLCYSPVDLGYEYYEQMPATVEGNTITVDFAGKLRASSAMSASGVKHPNFDLRLFSIRDARGQVVATGNSSMIGSYHLTVPYEEIPRVELTGAFTPVSGSDLAGETKVIIYVNNTDRISYSGVRFTSGTDTIIIPVAEIADIKQLSASEQEITVDIPRGWASKPNVEVSLHGIKSDDGYDHSDEVKAKYNGFTITFVDPAAGSQIDQLKKGRTITIDSNLDEGVALTFAITDNEGRTVYGPVAMTARSAGSYIHTMERNVTLYRGTTYNMVFTTADGKTETFALVGNGKEYEYNGWSLLTIDPADNSEIESGAVITLTFDGPVEIRPFGDSVEFTAVNCGSVEPFEGFDNAWKLTLAPEAEGDVDLRFSAHDYDGVPAQGNEGVEEESHYHFVYTISANGISEIEGAVNKADGIFDLQGRRLAAPVKGINIINGRKVLVK